MAYSLALLQQIVVAAAQQELLPRFTHVERRHKADGSVVTEADLAMQERIIGQLLRQWPETVVLGEEMSAEEQLRLLASDRPVWCLDPLDGTSNFAAGIPYFSVSLALLQKGRVELGVVYDPLRNECFCAARDTAPTLNGKPLAVQSPGLSLARTIAMVDFKRLDKDLAMRLAGLPPYASQRSFGSVALDWCWLAAGRGHVYLHGKQNLWDYAAGHFIFQAAGGQAATLAGEAVFANTLQPRSAVAAVDGALFAEWTAWLGVPARVEGF